MTERTEATMMIVTLARLAGVDPKKFGKEIRDIKKNTVYLCDMTEGVLNDAIKDKVFNSEEEKKMKDIFGMLKGDLNKKRYKDKEDGFKR